MRARTKTQREGAIYRAGFVATSVLIFGVALYGTYQCGFSEGRNYERKQVENVLEGEAKRCANEARELSQASHENKYLAARARTFKEASMLVQGENRK